MDRFFPEYLNQGSSGRAVVLLQLMLLFAGYNRNIMADGQYGNETAQGVKNLQMTLGFTGEDVDGHFGPRTRIALCTQQGIDIDAIPADAFSQETHAVDK